MASSKETREALFISCISGFITESPEQNSCCSIYEENTSNNLDFPYRNIKDFICRTQANKFKILFLWYPFQNMSCCKVREKQNTRLPGFADANATLSTCFKLLASTLNLLRINLLVFPKIRNPESGIRNPESGIRNPESGIRNPESGIRNPESGIRNPESGIRNPEYAIRNPESAIRNTRKTKFSAIINESFRNN